MDSLANPTKLAISGLHSVFSRRQYKDWGELEEEIRQIQETTEKGDVFEQFCYFFLIYHKDLYRIKEVWSDKIPGREVPAEIKQKYKLELTDYGVDGVSLLVAGGVEAWQAKFRSDQSAPTATELATFWSEAEYCESKRTIANSARLPAVAGKKINHEQTLLDRLLELDGDFFGALYAAATGATAVPQPPIYTPRPHQEAMLVDIVAGLQQYSRGKLIAACGTGKTLTALWISEARELGASKVLFFAPSISLVGQTVKEWVQHKNRDFDYLCVCSDQTIVSDLEDGEENSDIAAEDLDFQVTTTAAEVARWLKADSGKPKYLFSTYQSIPVIEEAVNLIGYKFDLAIFDEAHRTVGREDQFFARGLRDENIPVARRLFMTATERLVNPAVKTYAKKSGVEVFSMDDEEKYGPTLHDFNFGKAIKAGVIADYEIVLAVVSGEEELELIKNNAYIYLDDLQQEKVILPAELLFKAGFLIKALIAEEAGKVITFHASRKNAITFNRALDLISQNKSFGANTPIFTYVLGDQNSAERSVRISNFEKADRGSLGNVHVLSEGVDIPIVDAIYFVDPKKSLVDIVQGIGRALRKPKGAPKTAKVIVPIIISEAITNLDEVPWDETLSTFHAVIQAMRDQDGVLHEEINRFNEFAISGGKKGTVLKRDGNSKVKVITSGIKLARDISVEDFLSRITLRIATANADPTGTKMGFSHLGKGQRKSTYKPAFGILGDYNPDSYRDSLVMPTIKKFQTLDAKQNRESLKVNHNNIAHAERLGVIRQVAKGVFILTSLGRGIRSEELSFEDVFKNQMLLFSENGIFPYRVLFEILLKVGSLNHFEFLFGPYVMQPSGDVTTEINKAVERIEHIRSHYPALGLTSVSNREALTSELNAISPVEIAHNDIWGDRTTLKNKFRFLANHVSLFDVLEPRKEGYKEPIRLKPDVESEVREMLSLSEAQKSSNYGEWLWVR
jgi:superfamily II DNA or RNA helicase